MFEPLARLPLAAVMRRTDLLREGARALLLALVTLVAATVLTMLVLRGAGVSHVVADFHHNSTVHEIEHPPAIALIISACGAITGVVMVAAGRFTVLAGPIVALQLLPAVATLGMALELGEGDRALHALARLGIDIGLVLVAGLLVFGLKQARAHGHRRTSL